MNALVAAWIMCALSPDTSYCVTLDETVPLVIAPCYADPDVSPGACQDIVDGWFPESRGPGTFVGLIRPGNL